MGKLIIPSYRQADFNLLDAKFQSDTLNLVTSLPIDYILADAHRSIEKQDGLFFQGRDAEGNIIDKSKVVTNARGGQSPHNFGIAVDLLPVNPATGQGDWNYDTGFKLLAEAAKKAGLNPGYYWKFKDSPHVERAGFSWKKLSQLLADNQKTIAPLGILLILILSFILYKINSYTKGA